MWLIVGIIIAVLCFAVLGYSANDKRWKLRGRQIVALLPVLLVFGDLVAIVPANNVGVMYSPFGGVKSETLAEGFHLKGLFDTVYNITTEVQSKSLTALSSQTKDSQYISMAIDIKYRVNPESAFEVFKQFRNMVNVDANLISPAVQRTVEIVTTKYNIMEILGEKRNTIYTEIEKELETTFAKSGISFYSVTFVDTDAGDSIEAAIQNEAVAKKAVQTAEQERQKAEIEAQTKLIVAQAEADSNKILTQAITPELLAKMEMDARLKWGWVTVQAGNVIADVGDTSSKTE